jgi:hypothetical protein
MRFKSGFFLEEGPKMRQGPYYIDDRVLLLYN